MRLPPISTLFPYTTLFRSEIDRDAARRHLKSGVDQRRADALATLFDGTGGESDDRPLWQPSGGVNLKDRKSTRLNSSHRCISYAVFCLKKKKTQKNHLTTA